MNLMREILFRGVPKDKSTFLFFQEVWKDCCDGNFVKGSLIVSKGKYYICVSAMCQINSTINNGITSMIEVIPETLSQYILLDDKKGNKIFDGAILEITREYYNRKEKSLYKVRYHEATASFCAFAIDFLQRVPLCQKECRYYEIIGNIHDNPELLKGGAK